MVAITPRDDPVRGLAPPLTGPRDSSTAAGRPRWPALGGRLLTWSGAFARYGGAGTAGALAHRLRGRSPGSGSISHQLTRMCVRLGPTFVKGGQLLSTRKDLLPPHWCDALGQLHDRVDPMPGAQARAALATAYPPGTAWPFAEFDWTPAASGSIACVYRARLHDGREVAVKVRRPEIRDRMLADFALLGMGARVMQWMPGLRKVPARRMVEQLGFAVLRQLDLTAEAAALRSLRSNLTGLKYFRIPEPLEDVSADGVLVMEFIAGLGRFTPGEMNNEQRREVVRRVLHGTYQMLFLDGVVHCDMHPGNLYLTRDAQVVLLDAGFVVPLQPRVKRLFAEFFLQLSMGRGDECAETVLRSAEHVPPGADVEAFRRGIIELVAYSTRKTAGEFRLAPFATRLFDLQRRSGIAAAPEFIFPLVSLLVLEGMINDFDIHIDFQAEAIPTLLTALRR